MGESDLYKILTPALLTKIHDLLYPWPKGSTLDFSVVGYHLHTGEFDNDDGWKAACLESAIRPIFTMGVDSIISDWLQFLPAPESPGFPLLCAGLILLFDQAPSHVVDGRQSAGQTSLHAARPASVPPVPLTPRRLAPVASAALDRQWVEF